VTFAHPIKLEAIDVDVAGCSKLMLELHVDGQEVDLDHLVRIRIASFSHLCFFFG